MTIEHQDVEALGAEALPSGLAEIQQALRPAPKAGAPETPRAERRDSSRSGFSGRRKQQTEIVG